MTNLTLSQNNSMRSKPTFFVWWPKHTMKFEQPLCLPLRTKMNQKEVKTDFHRLVNITHIMTYLNLEKMVWIKSQIKPHRLIIGQSRTFKFDYKLKGSSEVMSNARTRSFSFKDNFSYPMTLGNSYPNFSWTKDKCYQILYKYTIILSYEVLRNSFALSTIQFC